MMQQLSFLGARNIIVTVERPNGTTYEQEVVVRDGETPKQAANRYVNEVLGSPYGWRTERGQKIRYIKRDAYLLVGWRWN